MLRLSLLVHTATKRRRQPPTSHCSTYQPVHKTKLSSSTLAGGYNPLCDDGISCSTAAQGSNFLCITRKATHCYLHAGADGAQATGIVEFCLLATANVVVYTCCEESFQT